MPTRPPNRSTPVRSRLLAALAAGGLALGALLTHVPTASAENYAPGVTTQTIWDSTTPLTTSLGQAAPGLKAGRGGVTKVAFGARGDAVVAERGGRLIWFSGMSATKGTVLTDRQGGDLSDEVLNVQDTGMSSVALDPEWPWRPYLYVFLHLQCQAAGGRPGPLEQ